MVQGYVWELSCRGVGATVGRWLHVDLHRSIWMVEAAAHYIRSARVAGRPSAPLGRSEERRESTCIAARVRVRVGERVRTPGPRR